MRILYLRNERTVIVMVLQQRQVVQISSGNISDMLVFNTFSFMLQFYKDMVLIPRQSLSFVALAQAWTSAWALAACACHLVSAQDDRL